MFTKKNILYLWPLPIKYVLVPCNVIGLGLHPNIRIIRLDIFVTMGIIAGVVISLCRHTKTNLSIAIRKTAVTNLFFIVSMIDNIIEN